LHFLGVLADTLNLGDAVFQNGVLRVQAALFTGERIALLPPLFDRNILRAEPLLQHAAQVLLGFVVGLQCVEVPPAVILRFFAGFIRLAFENQALRVELTGPSEKGVAFHGNLAVFREVFAVGKV
jgi:hypothetical protein